MHALHSFIIEIPCATFRRWKDPISKSHFLLPAAICSTLDWTVSRSPAKGNSLFYDAGEYKKNVKCRTMDVKKVVPDECGYLAFGPPRKMIYLIWINVI